MTLPDLSGSRLIDLTHPLQPGVAVYPGDPAFRQRTHSTLATTGWRVTELTLGTHLGTHVDAPAHLLAEAATVDRLPLETLVGPAVVVDVPGTPGAMIEPALLDEVGDEVGNALRPGCRVVFRSGWDVHFGTEKFYRGHPGLSVSAARWLVERGVALVGFDVPSPAEDAEPVHRILLETPQPIVIVESLANLALLPRHFTLVVLPLRLAGLDGSPVRAIALV